jgi:anti-sigma regulatory factor (Ser/Thr protein kinase)
MEHGNRMQENEQVEIHFNLDDDSIQVTVLDNGSGFDFMNWRPPDDLMRERGRGILIMREFTDGLEFDYMEDGRFRVRLTKNFNSKP